VWQEAMALIEEVYVLTTGFPADERFGLTTQLRRASVSVASNIAEGHARYGTRDFLRFIGISAGSLAEVEAQLEVASRLGFAEASKVDALLMACDQLGKTLRGLSKSLNNKLVP
jgi:four helix bundle protein